MTRKQVLVSGYYGFDNLGDEAILEELICELKEFCAPENIVILSNNPEQTEAKFAVKSINRWKLLDSARAMLQSKLFISGGGGLFQDSHSTGSVVYYGGQILLARALGAKTLVYAQGLGPLHRKLSRTLTSFFFKLVNKISVRDQKSQQMLKNWNIESELTADPVWALTAKAIEEDLQNQLKSLRLNGHMLVGLSLRNGTSFGDGDILALAAALDKTLPAEAVIIPLPLQQVQDQAPLLLFQEDWQKRGRQLQQLDLTSLKLPGQWLNLISHLDCLIGMRLHSLIMALASGIPVLGIAYDPKVEAVLRNFEQPALPYGATADQDSGWRQTIGEFLAKQSSLKEKASTMAQKSRLEACKNRDLIAKILKPV
jgi:polysaccharide pyruvyl transferase CsaB